MIGAAVGAAMTGLRPVVEIQFNDFIACGMDQLCNQAAKIRFMMGGQVAVPMVLRAPCGATGRAAQHSQSLEAWFMHTPGLKVLMPSSPYDAKGLLKSAIRDDNPVIVLEGEMLYNTKGEVPDEEYVIPLGRAELKREGDQCSIIASGKMVLVAMQAADQLAKEGIKADVLDLRTIRPMDVDAITASVRKTNRAVVLEEGWEVCGIGAQVVDYIQRDCFDDLDAPVIRVHQADVPMPYAKALERAAKPDVPKTIAAVKKVMYLEA
jgi:pyruvate dehydrogenase E1 component beta subunit